MNPASLLSIIFKTGKKIALFTGLANSGFFMSCWRLLLNICSRCLKISHALDHLLTSSSKDISGLKPEQVKILSFIGSLGAGGSERQFSVFVSALKSMGYLNTRVLTLVPPEGNSGHYLPVLQDSGIHVSSLGKEESISHPDIEKLPFMIRPAVKAVYNEIIKDPPDVFHAWLDYPNVIGGLAALIAGVPKIILSTRSFSPYHFPHFFKPWFKCGYQFLAKSPRVHFINNSISGGKDYAQWLDLPFERFKIVLNGIDPEEMKKPKLEQIAEFRKSLGLAPDTIVLCGIFRQTAEKRPEMFFRVADAILKKHKNVCVLHAGGGPLQEKLENKIEKADYRDRFKLLGRRDDVPVILSASDILLLTSRFEGTPNVILEAGCMGVSVVATAAGGVPDCIENGKTGFVLGLDDESSLVESISRLVEDESLRKNIAAYAPKFIGKRFGMQRMIEETLELYGK